MNFVLFSFENHNHNHNESHQGGFSIYIQGILWDWPLSFTLIIENLWSVIIQFCITPLLKWYSEQSSHENKCMWNAYLITQVSYIWFDGIKMWWKKLWATLLTRIWQAKLQYTIHKLQTIYNYKITISKPIIKSYYFDFLFWSFGVVICPPRGIYLSV